MTFLFRKCWLGNTDFSRFLVLQFVSYLEFCLNNLTGVKKQPQFSKHMWDWVSYLQVPMWFEYALLSKWRYLREAWLDLRLCVSVKSNPFTSSATKGFASVLAFRVKILFVFGPCHLQILLKWPKGPFHLLPCLRQAFGGWELTDAALKLQSKS